MSQPDRPSAAFSLSLIGGILGLIAGLFLSLTMWLAILGVYIIVVNLVILVGAIMLYQDPNSTRTWGIVVLVMSILSAVNIIGLIGGILAITWKPKQPTSTVSSNSSGTIFGTGRRVCPQCGRILNVDVKFCPHCGYDFRKFQSSTTHY